MVSENGDVVPENGDIVSGAVDAGPGEDSAVTDLNTLEVLLAVAKKMSDPTVHLSLAIQRDKLLRAVRRSDKGIACAANSFLQSRHADLMRMQQAAKLGDTAKKKLKHVRLLTDTVRKQAFSRKRQKLQNAHPKPLAFTAVGFASFASASTIASIPRGASRVGKRPW